MSEEDITLRATLQDDASKGLKELRRELEQHSTTILKAAHANTKQAEATQKAGLANERWTRGADVLGRSANRAARSLGNTFVAGAKQALSAVTSLTGVAGGVGLLALGVGLINVAGNAQATANKFNTVFGPATIRLTGYIERTSKVLGITQTQLKGAAATFGQIGKAAGAPTDKLADFSGSLVQAGLDIAAFNNLDPSALFTDITSALHGNSGALDQFGVKLDEETLKQEAARQGVARYGQTLSENQKVLLRQRLILAQVDDAQGAAGRSVDTISGKYRKFKGMLSGFIEQIAVAASPFIARGLERLSRWLEGTGGRLSDVLSGKELKGKGVADQIDFVVGAGGRLAPILDTMGKAAKTLVDALSWMIDHKGAVEGVFALWAGGKALSFADKLLGIVRTLGGVGGGAGAAVKGRGILGAIQGFMTAHPVVATVTALAVADKVIPDNRGGLRAGQTDSFTLGGGFSTDRRSILSRGIDLLNPFGDTNRPHALSGNLASTLAGHASIERIIGGKRRIVSGYRTFALGSAKSDHLMGRALDLQGPGLPAYKSAVEGIGGHAEFHGSDRGRHLHVSGIGDTSRPWSGPIGGAGGGGMNVTFAPGAIVVMNGDPGEVQRAVVAALKAHERDQRERLPRGAR